MAIPVVTMPPGTTDAASLRRYGVTHVIGCVDPSVRFADEVCALLGFASNGMDLSAARRNKAKMVLAVKAAGIPVPGSAEVTDSTEAVRWASAQGFPVVMKPVESGGSDNVHLCGTDNEVRVAFRAIMGATNLMGGMNTSALVQEYIEGDEYAVDCVSFAHEHVLVDCFRYGKGDHNGRAFVYEKEWSIDPKGDLAEKLHGIASTALDALGFRVGPSHMELKVTSTGEIVFLEVGPRLSGGDTHRLVRDLRRDGRSQVELSVDAYLGLAAPRDATLVRHGVRVYAINNSHGVVRGYRHLEEIERLPSYRRTSLKHLAGERVSPTQDLSTDVGWIDLAHEDPAILARDEADLSSFISMEFIDVDRD